MVFQLDENLLKKRLKFLLPISFLMISGISMGVYIILLKTIYKQNSILKTYIFIFMVLLTIVIAITLFFDCLKVENGKFLQLGKRFVLKTAIGIIIAAFTAYLVYIIDGSITVFEVLNIRLIMGIFLICMSVSLASLVFNFLVNPLYKLTGKKEYYLPLIYSFLPISSCTVVFIITLINGLHYRAEFQFYRSNFNNIQKEITSDFVGELDREFSVYVNTVRNIAYYLNVLNQNGYNFENYVNGLYKYLSTRYANDLNINSFSIYFYDIPDSPLSINNPDVNSIYISLIGGVNYLFNVSTNYAPIISSNQFSKIKNSTNYSINIVKNSDSFYIYNPIIYNNKNVGYISLEVNSSVYLNVLNNTDFKNKSNLFILDSDFSVKANNNDKLLAEIQSIFSSIIRSVDIRNRENNNYINNSRNTKIVYDDASKLFFIKYFLYNDLYIINSWIYENPYDTSYDFRKIILNSSIVIYTGLFLFIVVVLLLILSLRKTLKFATNVSESLSEGDGDVTIRLPILSNNELGDLVLSFNKFLDKIEKIIVSVKNNAYILTGNIQNMRASISMGMTDFETIYKEFQGELENSHRILESSTNATRVSFMQRTKFKSVNELIYSLLENINDINQKMNEQSKAVSNTTLSVQQMISNIVKVSHGASKANKYAKALYKEAKDGSNIGESVMDSIQSIKEYSNQITNITQVIHNIAEHTNLLAMNAAIEAAHAGEHGRGFTVVADKIRKLAEDTGENSKIISEIIEETTQAIDKTVALAFKSSESMEKILEGSNVIADIISVIYDANEELDNGRKGILSDIANLNSLTEYVQELSLKQVQMSQTVSQNIDTVNKLTEDVVDVVNSTEGDIKRLSNSIEKVIGLSSTTIDSMETMDRRIKELQYIFLQLYKLVILFKTDKDNIDNDSK